MAKIIRLADQEGELLTRSQGERLRRRIEEVVQGLEEGDRVAIDFSQVSAITPSFADECFGKLAERLGAERFRATISLNGADETVRTLVNAVLSERLARTR